MKNITQKEFEEIVTSIISKKVTRIQAAQNLETDIRTLNHKITELAQTNPALFEEYIAVFPYQPKEIKVNIEDLAVSVIKNGLTRTSKATEISIRSIARKVKTLEKTNPELYELYRHRNDKRSGAEEAEFQRRLEELAGNPIVVRSELKEKEEEIRKILTEFETLVKSGLSKAEAARRLGFADYPTIWKQYQKMKRIESEKRIKEAQHEGSGEARTNRAKGFRDSIKADMIISKQADEVEGAREVVEKREAERNRAGKTEGKQREGR